MNITRKEKENYQLAPEKLMVGAEADLYKAWQKVAKRLTDDLANDNYDQAFSTVAELKINVDTFFDEVMVMVDDQTVRENRLALLQGIAADFKKIADFSKL